MPRRNPPSPASTAAASGRRQSPPSPAGRCRSTISWREAAV